MIIIKVGGSLFDLPELRERLTSLIRSFHDPDCLLIPGGAGAADAVRQLDRVHQLGEEACHWLALRACSLNAHFLLALLRDARILDWPTPGAGLAVLDALAFAQADDNNPGSLPHSWDVTSDSLAARVAAVAGADLVLLKSVTIPKGMTWSEAGTLGYVDPVLPRLIERDGLRLRAVNLRDNPAAW